MDLIKPHSLKPGDTVAIVSASWGGPATFPLVYEAGLKNLQELFGLKIKEMPTARMTPAELYANPEARAADFNAAFADPTVSAIIASIGGDDSIRILPFLDVELARSNPKILMGYSDTAIETIFYNMHGLVTFNGPAVMAGFAQMKQFDSAAVDHVKAMLFEPRSTYEYKPFTKWANNYANWQVSENADQVAELHDHDDWHWLQGNGVSQGQLFGGCIEVLEFLKGTSYWPPPDFWQGKILFLETSEDKPSITYIRYWLRNYGMQGILGRLSGLLIGRARDYTTDEKADLDKAVKDIVVGEFGVTNLPIVTNLDFGHTDPQWIVPLGINMGIDSDNRRLSLLESPTK